MTRTLVTGGAGFIGSHVVDELLRCGHQVVALDNLATGSPSNLPPRCGFARVDITDGEALGETFRQSRPDVVFHQAAQTLVAASSSDPHRDATVNVLGTLNVVAAAIAVGARKVIFASSGGTVYGEASHQPVGEDEPLRPISPYGVSKVAGEHYVRALCEQHGVSYTLLRYANVYGPRDIPASQHVVTAFLDALNRGEAPVIEWDGEQSKDYVYVEDVAEANVLAITAGDNQALNIGSGLGLTVNRIFDMVCSLMATSVRPQRREKRPNDVRQFTLDCSKASRVLGWHPRTHFGEGLLATIDYYRQQPRREAVDVSTAPPSYPAPRDSW